MVDHGWARDPHIRYESKKVLRISKSLQHIRKAKNVIDLFEVRIHAITFFALRFTDALQRFGNPQ